MNPDNDHLKAWKFLTSNRLAAIATVNSENAPEASFVYYLTDDNFHLYIVTAKDSRKIKNISQNNKVALVVGQEMEPIVMQVEGTIKLVEDEDKKHELSHRYLETANINTRTPNWPPVMKLAIDNGYVFGEITITYFKFSDFTDLESTVIEGTPQDWQATEPSV